MLRIFNLRVTVYYQYFRFLIYVAFLIIKKKLEYDVQLWSYLYFLIIDFKSYKNLLKNSYYIVLPTIIGIFLTDVYFGIWKTEMRKNYLRHWYINKKILIPKFKK